MRLCVCVCVCGVCVCGVCVCVSVWCVCVCVCVLPETCREVEINILRSSVHLKHYTGMHGQQSIKFRKCMHRVPAALHLRASETTEQF